PTVITTKITQYFITPPWSSLLAYPTFKDLDRETIGTKFWVGMAHVKSLPRNHFKDTQIYDGHAIDDWAPL
ncbi:hypothetical protein E4U10_002226, partial [Claviceps purpurea]